MCSTHTESYRRGLWIFIENLLYLTLHKVFVYELGWSYLLHAVRTEAKRGYQIPWNRWLLVAM